MRKSFSRGLTFAIAALLGVGVLAWSPAYAGIEVQKEITGIDADNNGVFEIVGADITPFLAAVPSGTVISFQVKITVSSTDGQDLTDVVVTDRFGAELSVACADPISGLTVLCPAEVSLLLSKGTSQKVFLTWTVGSLAPGASADLYLVATTKLDPGGNQSYTACGPHEFNSGASAKGRYLGKQVSHVSPPITLTVSGAAFPQCCNCQDDDGDGLTDYPNDPGCEAPDDPDESDPIA